MRSQSPDRPVFTNAFLHLNVKRPNRRNGFTLSRLVLGSFDLRASQPLLRQDSAEVDRYPLNPRRFVTPNEDFETPEPPERGKQAHGWFLQPGR
jgi:hypothetical protein